MPILLNGAGGSAADPILDGLRIKLVTAASTLDVAAVNDVFVDTAAGFPGSNSVRASLSPAATVLIAGTAGSYDDGTDQLTISSTTGLSAGDPLFLSHASITDGIYLIASVVDGTRVTLTNDPFAGGGAQSSISYQVGWSYDQAAGTAPISSSPAGQINYLKADLQDASAQNTQSAETFYVRDAPAGSAYIALDGTGYTGQVFSDTALTLAILAAWANKGGIATVQLVNHSVQAVNNFTFGGGGTTERAIATAETQGLVIASGDGPKYGAIRFRSLSGSASFVDVDIECTLDTAGPTIVFNLFGV